MSKDSSAKWLQKKSRKRYQNLFKEEKEKKGTDNKQKFAEYRKIYYKM